MGNLERPLLFLDFAGIVPAICLHLNILQNKRQLYLSRPCNGGVGRVSVFVNGNAVIEEANALKGFKKHETWQ